MHVLFEETLIFGGDALQTRILCEVLSKFDKSNKNSERVRVDHERIR